MGMFMPQTQLLTPEEPVQHSFNTATQLTRLPPVVPSPPESPSFRSFSADSAYQQNDEILYPDQANGSHSTTDRPLFESNRLPTPERQSTPAPTEPATVATPAQSQLESHLPSAQDPTKPVSDDQQAAAHQTPAQVSPQSNSSTPATQQRSNRQPVVGVYQLYNTYGLDYYRYILAQNEQMAASRREARALPPVSASNAVGRDRYTQQLLSSLTRSSRVEKPRTTTTQSRKVARACAPPKFAAKNDVSSVVTAAPKRESPAKRNRRPTTPLDASGAAVAQVAQPKPRTRAAPSKKVEGNNADWADIPDHCPPLESLDTMGKKLTVQWSNSNALDLSNDPNRMHLHPQELEIAQVLRLKCDAYLANKRRIFAARLHHMREGKEFNKTSAQNATQIDVNKASRLWAAFDSVGWFDEKWFTPQL